MQHKPSNHLTTRRTLLAVAAAATSLVAATVSAQTKTIYIGMNGGQMEKIWTEHIFPAFEKANNAKVVVVPGTSSEVLAKA